MGHVSNRKKSLKPERKHSFYTKHLTTYFTSINIHTDKYKKRKRHKEIFFLLYFSSIKTIKKKVQMEAIYLRQSM